MIVSQMVAHTTIHDDSEFHAEVFVVFKLLLLLRREGRECACLIINDARAYLVRAGIRFIESSKARITHLNLNWNAMTGEGGGLELTMPMRHLAPQGPPSLSHLCPHAQASPWAW